MRKLFAIIFLLVLSMQVLPVKAIGKMLGKSQTTEEVEDAPSSDDDADVMKGKFGEDLFLQYHTADIQAQQIYYSKKQAVILHSTPSLPTRLIEEVQTPPPDCFSML